MLEALQHSQLMKSWISHQPLLFSILDQQLSPMLLAQMWLSLIPHIFRSSDTILDRQYEFLDVLYQKISAPNFTIGIDCDWAEDYQSDLPFILSRSDSDQAQCQISPKSRNLCQSTDPHVNTKYYRDIVISQAIIHLILGRPYTDGLIDIDINLWQRPYPTSQNPQLLCGNCYL